MQSVDEASLELIDQLSHTKDIDKTMQQSQSVTQSTKREATSNDASEDEVETWSKRARKMDISYTFDSDDATLKLVRMIVMHELPFKIVEFEEFKDYSRSLQPYFKMPCRNTVRSEVMKMYKHEKSEMMKIFEENQSRIAITTDMWTSSQRKSFMAITAHYIDDSWSSHSRIIRFVYVASPHNADELRNVLVDTLLDWDLGNKLSTLTLDNCSTDEKLINLILDELSRKNLLLDGSLLRMHCCARTLNLIAKDGLKYIGDCIDKIRNVIIFWTDGPERVEKFENVLRQLKVPYTKKLALDISSRWNSTYLMLDSVLSYKHAFNCLQQGDSQVECFPSNEEWKVVEEMFEKLKLFYRVVEIFSQTKYSTINLFIPRMFDIKVALTKWQTCGSTYFQTIASEMVEKFDKYWDEIDDIMSIAVVLDPRFKHRLLKYYYNTLYGEEVSKLKIERVKRICNDLMVEYARKIEEAESSKPSFQSTKSESPLYNQEWEDKIDQFLASLETQEDKSAQAELDRYLKERLLPRKVDFDILGWWSQAYTYPILQLIARDILAIPISTVVSEFAFGTNERVISDHRSGLRPDTIEALMCTQNWLWSEKGID